MKVILWWIKYAWVKLNIWVLTPLVYIQNQYKEFERMKLEMMCNA